MWEQAGIMCKVLIDWTVCVVKLGMWIVQHSHCGFYTAEIMYCS